MALPVGLYFASRVSFPRPLTGVFSPAMADCTTQPSVSEIVARADELYEANQMREGLSYLKQQYGHLDEVEVTLLALTIYAYNRHLSVGLCMRET